MYPSLFQGAFNLLVFNHFALDIPIPLFLVSPRTQITDNQTMHTLPSFVRKGLVLGTAVLCTASLSWAQTDVTQPGDIVIASSPNSPGSEGVANAIDNNTTKYLNFDSGRDGAVSGFSPSGFVVTPAVGATRLTGIAMQSANDGPERDPKDIRIEGSNDDTITGFNSGNWTLIAEVLDIPTWQSVFGPNTADHRFKTQTFSFENNKPYKHYRWTVTETQGMGAANTCCMQIAEVEFLGTVLPPDVTQPGDPIIASSPNSPGSEGVANAIDNNTTKYLNFDSGRDGAVSGFSPSGFVVSPSIGDTLVTGISLQSANDGPERDPRDIRLEGSNDAAPNWTSGTWEVIAEITEIPSWQSVFGPNTADHRFKTQTFLFDNFTPYRHYRWTVTETQGMGAANTCCMQIAEVELLGTGAPQDITQPGDQIFASSPNSPGSEGVANAIDNNTTKYLNFDSGRDGAVNGFSPSGFAVTPSIGATTVIGVSMQSANDGPERDPKDIRLEGSNDDTITGYNSGTWELVAEVLDIPSWQSVFGPNTADHRFKTQTFYFPNDTAYKHYRWVVTETQGMGAANTCCMQIAEVELLAVTVGAPCDTARFISQPVNTPVLDGSAATFFVDVNGPWPLQWYRNGLPIAGATQRSFTTAAVTAANADDLYSVEIVGCESSAEVQAVLFTPSTTQSIGINFPGNGANAAPTDMLADDIAGVHLQAYWNNAPNVDDGAIPDTVPVPPVPPLVNSNNEESTITFSFDSAGRWGSGAGEGSATQRLLNGIIGGNGPNEVSTYTFANVPAGTHSVLVYNVSPPLQFQNVSYAIGGTTYYIRAMNSDEYNAAPGYYRGSSTTANSPSIANYVRFDNVQPVNNTITLTVTTITGAAQATGVAGVQLLLNSQAAPPPPAITVQPQPTTVVEGNATVLTVTATGDNLSYQWRKNNRTLPNGGNISGATTATLRIANATEADEGVYSVAVFNAGGSEISENVSLRITACDIEDALAAYFKFNETSGTTAANSVAGGQDATIVGGATWGAGQIGNSLGFDGFSSYGTVPDYPKASEALAVSGWVFLDASSFAGATFVRNAEGNLGVTGASIGQFEFGYVMDQSFNPVLTGAIGVGPNIISVSDSQAFTKGEWHHVALTADGAQLRLFLNGQQVASTDYLGNINDPAVDYLTFGARLAIDQSTGEPNIDFSQPDVLLGRLDDFAIWNRSLTGDEITQIFMAGEQAQAADTVTVDCPPDVGGGDVALVVERSGNNVTISWEGSGTLQSAPTVDGPWSDVTGVTGNSHTVDASSGTAFYRLLL